MTISFGPQENRKKYKTDLKMVPPILNHTATVEKPELRLKLGTPVLILFLKYKWILVGIRNVGFHLGRC
jgi:hypothetical protein